MRRAAAKSNVEPMKKIRDWFVFWYHVLRWGPVYRRLAVRGVEQGVILSRVMVPGQREPLLKQSMFTALAWGWVEIRTHPTDVEMLVLHVSELDRYVFVLQTEAAVNRAQRRRLSKALGKKVKKIAREGALEPEL